jgi:prophage regulatory protein
MQTTADSPSDSPPPTSTLPALLSTSELLAHLGISRPTLVAWMARGNFPRPIQLGPARHAWKVSEVDQWLHGRPRG